MKIAEVRIYLIKSGYHHPVIVQLRTESGVTGIGEAAIAYGLGGTAAAGMVKDLAERMVIGADARQIEPLWYEMYDHSFWAKGGGAIVFAAMSAIEQALWDIKGKVLGVPVYELLGGAFRHEVRVYANGWGQPHSEIAPFVAAGVKSVSEGYSALKCYPFAYRDARTGTFRHPSLRAISQAQTQHAYERVKELRAAVGPDVEIMLDLSGGLTTDETIRFCRRIEKFDIAFVEEPADPFDVGALKKISDSIGIPVAGGERLYTRFGFRKVLESHALDIVQPDIGNTGGLMEAKKIAAMAEAYGMRVQPHVCGTPLQTAVALQLAACIPNFYIQELYPNWQHAPGYVEVLVDPPEGRVRNGKIDIPSRPGLGAELRMEAVEPFLWAVVAAP